MTTITLARLREVRHIQKEIEDLEQYRLSLYYPIVSPSFSGIHSTEPGDPTAKAFDALQRLDDKITVARTKLLNEEGEIMDWLYDEFGDGGNEKKSVMRRIIICHYLQGMTWEETTRHVLGYYGTESARNYVYRYFEVRRIETED